MSWLFYALIAPALDTFINFADKYIVSKELKDYRGVPIYTAITSLIVGTAFWIISGSPMLSIFDGLIVITTGILTIFGLAIYFKALSLEETSNIIILLKMIPVLILILSLIFLNDIVTVKQFIGFILILLSVYVVSIQNSDNKKKKGFHLSEPFVLILAVDVLWAIAAVLIKFAINANSFTEIVSYEAWGVALGGLILYSMFSSIRRSFLKSLKTVRKIALGIMFISETIFVFSKGITFYAYSLGPAALVSVVGSTQVYYGILFGVILTMIAPSIFKEDISKETLTRKIIASAVLLIGIWLVS